MNRMSVTGKEHLKFSKLRDDAMTTNMIAKCCDTLLCGQSTRYHGNAVCTWPCAARFSSPLKHGGDPFDVTRLRCWIADWPKAKYEKLWSADKVPGWFMVRDKVHYHGAAAQELSDQRGVAAGGGEVEEGAPAEEARFHRPFEQRGVGVEVRRHRRRHAVERQLVRIAVGRRRFGRGRGRRRGLRLRRRRGRGCGRGRLLRALLLLRRRRLEAHRREELWAQLLHRAPHERPGADARRPRDAHLAREATGFGGGAQLF